MSEKQPNPEFGKPSYAKYPSNTLKGKGAQTVVKEKKVVKVIKGTVHEEKKSFGQKFKEFFFAEDIGDVGRYLMHDVFIPSIKKLFVDAIQGGSERMVWGDTPNPNRTRRDGGRSVTAYDNYFGPGGNRNRTASEPITLSRSRNRYERLVFRERSDAEEVLTQLILLIEDFKVASLADLNDLLEITGDFTDQKYGWKNLAASKVIRVAEGYKLDLPRVALLD